MELEDLKEEASAPHIAIIGDVYHDAKVYIVAEGDILAYEVDDFPKAVCLLFGLIYNLNLQYPVRYTYEYLQKVVMEIDSTKMSPRIRSLQNKLLA